MEYIASGPGVLLAASIGFLLFLLAFHGMGSLVLGDAYLDRKSFAGMGLYKVHSAAIGLFLLSFWMIICGSFGCINRLSVGAFLFAGLLLCVRDKKRYFADEVASIRLALKKLDTVDQLILAGLVLVAAVSFIACQAPPVGNDALAYHLYFPKLNAEHGNLFYDPYHVRSLWPSMMSMAYTAGFVLQGAALASTFSWLTGVLAVAAVPLAAHYFFKDRNTTRIAAVLAGFVPAVWMQSVYAYTDLAMMLYAFLMFLSALIWRKSGFTAGTSVVFGLMLSALLSMKYFTLVPAAILFALALVSLLMAPFSAQRKLSALFVVAAVAVLGAGFWFIRSWILLGNPVYPFANKLFGLDPLIQQGSVVGFADIQRTPLSFLLTPWNMAMRTDVYGGEPMGALFLAALPLAFGLRRAPALARPALFFALVFFVAWFSLIQHMRFFFPAFPFLAFGLAPIAAKALAEGTWRRVITAALAVIAGLQFGLCLYYPARILPAALGVMPARDYLVRHERAYAFFERIQPLLKPGDVLLSLNEPQLFYSPVPTFLMGKHLQQMLVRRGLSLDQWLAESGVTHIMAMSYDKNTDEYLDQWGLRRPMTEVRSADIDSEGRRYSYTLWKLS